MEILQKATKNIQETLPGCKGDEKDGKIKVFW
jgi:hypothetical protein